MPSRRDLLRFGLGSLLASAIPARGDDPKRSSTLYVFVREMVAGNQTIKNSVIAVDPDQDTWHVVSSVGMPFSRISPDGKTIAFIKPNQEPGIWLAEVEGDAEPKKIADLVGRPFWSSDGKTLVISSRGKGSWKIAADGSKTEKLPFPDEDLIVDWSRDGQWVVVESTREEADRPLEGVIGSFYAVRLDNTDARRLSRSTGEIVCWQHRFTNDSKAVIYFRVEDSKEADDCSLYKVDIDGKNARKFVAEGEDEAPFHWCPSPDGKRMAMMMFDRSRRNPDDKKNSIIKGCTVQIADADGKNGRVLSVPVCKELWLMNWVL